MTVHRWLAARVLAPLLVLALALGSALPLATHAAGDDPCDGPSPGAAGGPAVAAAHATSSAQHCEICHFLRLLRGADAVTLSPLPRIVLATAPGLPTIAAGSRLVVAGVPARAPPA